MTGLTADVAATVEAVDGGSFTVDVDLAVEPGETLVVLGPSGSGKTLLLETIAGFHPHEGTVALDAERVDDRPPERRGFGFVFQDYMLFPHLTAGENVGFGRQYHADTREPGALLAELGVGALQDRYPETLSGGEKQRVALARALAIRPDLLLLDEPLSALDVPTRQALRDDLVDVLADVTAVYVTHNRTTARAVADRIAVMHEGGVVQTGTPEAVFERPASPMVARFTGANCVPRSAVPSLSGLFEELGTADDHLVIRPEAVAFDEAAADARATVERVVREDATSRVTLLVDEATIEAFARDPPAVGDEVAISFPRDRLSTC